jgi:hypothetical protein
VDVARLKAQAREGWGKGNYSGLSEQLRPAARALADACAVSGEYALAGAHRPG